MKRNSKIPALAKLDSRLDKMQSLMFNLVDKRADKVDEAALQLWKLCCLRPVHHGLVMNEPTSINHFKVRA